MFLRIVYSTLPSSSEEAIRIGENFMLPCNMSNELSLFTSLTFSKNKSKQQRIAYKSETNAVEITKLFKDQLSLQPSGFLMLHNASMENNGLYTCKMELNNDETFQHEVQLYVGGIFCLRRGTDGGTDGWWEEGKEGRMDGRTHACMHASMHGRNE